MSPDDQLCLDVCKQVVDALRTPVLIANRDLKIMYANHAAWEARDESAVDRRKDNTLATFLGVSEEAVRDTLPEAWWADADPASRWETVEENGGKTDRLLCRMRRRKMVASSGEPLALIMFELPTPWEQRYLDTIKTQDGLAHALEAAEERFNVLFRESSDPVLILNPAGVILSANAGFERFTGLRTDQWFQEEKGWADCVHNDDLPLLYRSVAHCAADGVTDLVEVRMLSGENFYQWFELSLSPLHDEARKVRGMVCVARNINRRKELETQLREKAQSMQKRHQRAQLLIAKLKHFFSRVSSLPSDIDGYLGGVSETLNDMYRPYAVSVQVDSPEHRDYVEGPAAREHTVFSVPSSLSEHVLDTGLPLYCNALNLTDPYRDDPAVKAGGYITCLAAPLRDSTGTVRGTLTLLDTEKQYYDNVDVELITVAALHVAARLRAEEQEKTNRELADHLRQAQKMKAVGMLAGGIAHDFNNILSGILGFSSYLLSKVDADSTIHRDLKLIEQSAVRASELTRQLLSFARRKHFAKEAVAFNQIIHEVLSLVRRSAAKHVRIREDLEVGLPAIHGDPGQLNQVIMNLCLNAADAMREVEDGVLRLATEHRALTPRERIILGEDTDEEFVCVTVGDTGVGMSEDLQEHIYEPFYTTKSDDGGSGLGLSIVYGIISNHGGHLIVDSEEDHGSVFTLYFPVFRGAIRSREETPIEDLAGTETVLVIDDEPIVRQMVTEVLRGSGYKVVAAASGMEGVQYMDELRGRVDVVLLDMIMPEMDGEATFKALRHIDPELPIMLTSGYVQEEKRERLMQAGALGLVYKPYKSNELLYRIREVLNALAGKEVPSGA